MTTVAAQAPVPVVSVLVPVYNGAEHLPDALASLLAQTFANLEVIVVDDGSTDGSFDCVSACRDTRIRGVRQPAHAGLVAALNLGLDLARGEYVARMDADDISLPQRLEKQVAFMTANPEIGACGTWMETFPGTPPVVWKSPLQHDELCSRLLFESPIFHPTVMLRRAMLEKFRLRYDPAYPCAEDYELWCRCRQSFKLANLGEVLLRYRIHAQSVGSRKRDEKLATANRIRRNLLADLDLQPDAEEQEVHQRLSLWQAPASRAELEQMHVWLLRLMAANRSRPVFPEPSFNCVLAERWFHACARADSRGTPAYRLWRSSPLRPACRVAWPQRLRFACRSLMGR